MDRQAVVATEHVGLMQKEMGSICQKPLAPMLEQKIWKPAAAVGLDNCLAWAAGASVNWDTEATTAGGATAKVRLTGKHPAEVAVTAPLLPSLEYAVGRQKHGAGAGAAAKTRKSKQANGGFVVGALPAADTFSRLAIGQVLLDRGLVTVVKQSAANKKAAAAANGGIEDAVARCDAATKPPASPKTEL